LKKIKELGQQRLLEKVLRVKGWRRSCWLARTL